MSNGLAAWHRRTIKPRVRMGIAIGRSQIGADVHWENTCRADLNSALGGYTRCKPLVSLPHNHMSDQLVT